MQKKHLKNRNMESDELSLTVLRNIFKNNFHIGFHLPKKENYIEAQNA